MNIRVDGFPIGESEILAYESMVWKQYGMNVDLHVEIDGDEAVINVTEANGTVHTKRIKRIRGERPKMDNSEDLYHNKQEDIWE